jgi:hypothetical protein
MLIYELFDHPREGMGFLGEKNVDETGNANSGPPPDKTAVKMGSIQKLKTGIKHRADPSRYGGYEPRADNNYLLSPASRHRLHRAVTPDISHT